MPANAVSSAKLKAHLKRQTEEEEKAEEEEAKKKKIEEEEAKKIEEETKSGELISITLLNRLTIMLTCSGLLFIRTYFSILIIMMIIIKIIIINNDLVSTKYTNSNCFISHLNTI